MERSRAPRRYYQALGFSSVYVSQYDILQGYLRGKRLFPQWGDQLDRAFAVLSDPHLKSEYDLRGSSGLQAEWCERRLQNISRKLKHLWATRPPRPTTTTIVRFDSKGGKDGAGGWLVNNAPWVCDTRLSSDVEEKVTLKTTAGVVKVEPSMVTLPSPQTSSSAHPPRAFKRSRPSLHASSGHVTQSPSLKKSNEQFCVKDATCDTTARGHSNTPPASHPEVFSTTSRVEASGTFEVKCNFETRSEIIFKSSENTTNKEFRNIIPKNSEFDLKQSVSVTCPEPSEALGLDALNTDCCIASDCIIEKQNQACPTLFIDDRCELSNEKNSKVPAAASCAWPKNFPSTAWKANV